LNQILAKQPNEAVTLYNVACTYSLMDKKSESINYLTKATGNGYTDVDSIEQDTDLDNIRKEKEYRNIVENLKKTNAERESLAQTYEEGCQLLKGGKYKESIECFNQILAKHPNATEPLYNVACAYALMNNKEQAIYYLGQAVKSGFSERQHIEHDPDMDNIRSEKGYQKIMENLKKKES
jgi:tetratricopeptide (TPR) repeat protein